MQRRTHKLKVGVTAVEELCLVLEGEEELIALLILLFWLQQLAPPEAHLLYQVLAPSHSTTTVVGCKVLTALRVAPRGEGGRDVARLRALEDLGGGEQLRSLHVVEHGEGLGGNLEQVAPCGQDVACGGDVLGRAHLVAGEHPDLDAGGAQVSQDFGHAVLQLILESGCSLQRILLLEARLQIADRVWLAELELAHLLRVLVGRLVLDMPSVKIGQLTLDKDERAQRNVGPLVQERVESGAALGIRALGALGEQRTVPVSE